MDKIVLCRRLLSLSFILLLLPVMPQAQDKVYISEIMYDSPLNEQIATGVAYSNGEYVGLFNGGLAGVDLSGWVLQGGGKTEVFNIPSGTRIDPGESLLVAYQYNNSNFMLADLYDFNSSTVDWQILYQRKIILSNSGESVVLKDRNGMTKDSIFYDGTSNKSKPDRLSAENADGIPGSQCRSLQRINVRWDTNGNCVTENSDWTTGVVTLSRSHPSHVMPDGLSSDQNYILSRMMLNEEGTKYMDNIQYYDGLGRPSQNVQVGITPDGEDLVTLQEYDSFGRETRQWIPTPVSGRGGYVSDFTSQATSKHSDSNPYNETVYENSSLNRVIRQTGPGSLWHSAGKGIKNRYLVKTGFGNLRVSRYYVNSSGGLTRNGNYISGQLFCVETTDEDGNLSYTFTDNQEQIILVRQMNNGEAHDTYYVYDDFGNRCFVLPPMINDNISTDNLNKYAYQYKYDERNRCIETKLPGCEPFYQVYDRSDRLVLSQDGNQRKRNVWLVNKYDILGRLLYVSEVEEAGDVASIRKSFSGWLVTESFSTTPHQYPQEDTGYSKGFYHQAPTTLLTVYYYDDYQFLKLMPEKEIYLMYDPHWDKEGKKWGNAKGLLTGKRTYALDGSGNYTAMAYYYDAHGNIIQELSTNHLDGGDNHYYTYTFTGKVLKDVHEHSKDQTSFLDICTNTYDHAERLTSTTYNVFAKTITTNYSYDNLGRMKQKNINNIETIQYKYNIRNWLTDIISPNFTEKMYYANIGRCYNGNISRIDWKVGNEDITRNYLFKYDGLNRLTFADYAYCTSSLCANANSFDVKVESYDKQGNILQLSRYGRITPQQAQRIQSRIVNDDETPPADPYGIIDNLNYTYNGNQLKSVSDVSDNDPVYKDVMHFVDGADTDVEYTYDANGNMTSDRNKKIESIAYNNLNLPVLVSMERKSTIFNPGIALFPYTQNHIRYDYDAEGKKLRVSYGHSEGSMQRSGGVNMSIVYSGYTDYCDNFVYENDTLVKILLSEGYIACKDRTFHFYLKDHQGNNRVVANESGGIEQVNHYYPFGGLFGESSGGDVQKYKYGGKELERMHGIDLYDFSARMQDPVLGRFSTMDPMCEKYYSISPYVYCNNNPIMYIDPNGMDIYRYDEKTGTFYLVEENDDEFDQVGKFEYDKKNDEYVPRVNKNGEVKTLIDNVEKGILSDGINFKENSNIIAVGGEGQASVDGVESFILKLSDMVGKEIAGAYFSKDGAGSTTHMSIGKYANNRFDQANSRGHVVWNRVYPDSNLESSLTGFFHTHPNVSVSDRMRPSGKDKESRDQALDMYPHLQFYILTHPEYYGGKFPYKFPYTNWH